ncbi:2-oxoacid:acceptor oxidoreductase family protein [Sporomusa acidovorans]|uniref:NADH-dependent phenylglyoxylate dehydrogenase subunit gamma n=1 Tax=Sporomusa acidovorans (strain ATCC 49682 / DSM 3132 / Mol) TaxID=1123286 RepID=A0ABZ3J7M8_SPOA4|nr:2-oxoacid:acceptor oxidoreductase family protein [Sporomusa acidovorans]OZC16664.1 NADH-dependent phenylglyoxylate dehydrogenase subunit gamma [Sporomusa acidovorans DSM 3132]SDE06946.1 pyruvate ferredoxin oxidoreductase gamma subunit [Sporomusa acidovorans]
MKQIKLFGLGGQGVVTAAKIFAEAVAIGEGKHAQSIPAYGHERRGAPVYSDLIVSDEPIKTKSFVYEPDYVVIFDLSVIDKGIDVMVGTNANTVFIINHECVLPEYPFAKHQVYYVGAKQIALDTLKRDIPNSAMLGAMAGAGLVGLDAAIQAIRKIFGKAGDINAEAANKAYAGLRKN